MENYADLKQRKLPPADRKLYLRTKVARAIRTPIKLGVMLDTSFSMADMAELGTNVAWTIGEATRSVRGEVAVTTFGYDAWGLIGPGERTKYVPRLSMVGGPHEAEWAFEMVDSALNLVDGQGARVLVVCSDMEFGTAGLSSYINEALRAGVLVVAVPKRKNNIDEAFASPETLGMRVTPPVDSFAPDERLVKLCESIGEAIVAAATRARLGAGSQV